MTGEIMSHTQTILCTDRQIQTDNETDKQYMTAACPTRIFIDTNTFTGEITPDTHKQYAQTDTDRQTDGRTNNI